MTRSLPLLGVLITWSLVAPAAGAQVRRSPVVTTTRPVDVQVTVADEAHVRRTTAPPQFDDKGRPRKPSREELAKLKGDTPEDTKLGGYKWELDSLKKSDVVTVTISVPVAGSKAKAGKDAKDTRDAKDEPKPQRWVAREQL